MPGPKQLQNLRVSALRANSTVSALFVHTVDANGDFVSPGAGSTQVSVKEILTSSGASIMDSTNNAIGVTIRAGSAAGTEYTDGDVDATVSGGAILFDNSSNTLRPVTITRGLPVNVVAGAAGGSTQVSIKEMLTSSGGSILDSTEVAMRVKVSTGNVAVSGLVRSTNSVAADFQATVTPVAGSTWAVRPLQSSAADLQATVTPAAGSTWAVRPLQSSAADLQATVTPAAGSTWAVRPLQSSAADLQATVTPASGSTWSVRPLQSSQADLRATVYQSTAADLNVTVAGYSTTVQVSSLGGVVMARLQDSSDVGIAGSTGPTAVGVNGLVTREVMPTLQSTTVLITSSHSTALYALISSVASVRHKVYAYFISSTHTVPSTLVFMSSNAIDRWHVGFGSGSSGMTGANLALSPPSWIFHTDVNNALNVRIEGGSSVTSTVIARISIAWFQEA